MKKRVLYGTANYEEIVQKNGYFVDKTAYIEKLEEVGNPVFLRPRRFGKSLLCRMLECYYDINLLVLHLDFSTIEPTGMASDIENHFNHICNSRMKMVVGRNQPWFKGQVSIDVKDKTSSNLQSILNLILQNDDLPPLYVIIDEYDNFANQLITAHKDHLYHELTADDSFLKTFFKTLKEGRKTGAIANVFITGVLPITIDDMASGYNIANFITTG